MLEIDKTYEKVDKETTISYTIKREKLNKEEEDLKEKLKTEVTKIKEQLENHLSNTNNLIKSCERIIKGMKSLQNEETNMNKMLSYISMINKNEKEMNNLSQQFMKNLKITFNEKENSIKYEEYYFNGIPIPKNITFTDIEATSLKMNWTLEEINILNMDKNKIKYKIEIRKDNEQISQVYESNNTNYLINKLKNNTNYEIRVCAVFKGIKSNFSEYKKIKTKTKNIESKILNELEKGQEYLEKLYEWTGANKMELLYRGTRDGTGSNIFHDKCDNQGPTLCIYKNEKGNVFGGYASISWTSDGNYHSANESFLFSLTNIHGTAPTKFPSANQKQEVYHYKDYGPVFGRGYGLKICGDYLNNNNSYAKIDKDYQDVLGKGFSTFSGDINNNHFKLKELEVFKVHK